MKKSVLLLIGFLIVIGIVSACAPEQRIMKLSSGDNAHGALWNYSVYNYEICYNDFFSGSYAGTSPHNCTGTNRIISLSSSGNAHASVSQDAVYNTDVCYGDLICTARTGCNADETAVVRLSSNSNAHLSTSLYSTIICCKMQAIPSIPPATSNLSSAYWADMNNNAISFAVKGSRVMLIANGSGMSDKHINYTIYKQGGLWIFWDAKVASSSSIGSTTWLANDDGTFYFKAKIIETGEEKQSGDLVVSNSGITSPPNVEITSPVSGIYFKNNAIYFSQRSSDTSGYFNYTWNLGDGTIKKGSSNNKENWNFTYSYNKEGQKNIILEATNEQGLTSSDSVSILVINETGSGTYVFAIIDHPRMKEKFLNPPNSLISFNADSSYAINSTPSSIVCSAGNCPNQTVGCRNGIIHASCRESITGTPNTAGFALMNFTWIFDSGLRRSGLGTSGSSITQLINTAGWHVAELEAGFNFAVSSANTIFFVSFDKAVCRKERDNSYWIEGNNQFSSLNNCHKNSGDVVAGSSTDCCPVNSRRICSSNICVDDAGGIESCSDYATQSSCQADASNIASSELESANFQGYCSSTFDSTLENGKNCYKQRGNCRCGWNANAGNCTAVYNVTKTCFTDSGDITESNFGSCEYSLAENTECIAGYRSIFWNATWVGTGGDSSCSGITEKSVRCPEELDFFGTAGIIIAVVLVVVFYLLTKKNKKSIKKKL